MLRALSLAPKGVLRLIQCFLLGAKPGLMTKNQLLMSPSAQAALALWTRRASWNLRQMPCFSIWASAQRVKELKPTLLSMFFSLEWVVELYKATQWLVVLRILEWSL